MRLIKLTAISGMNDVEFTETHLNVDEIESFVETKKSNHTILLTKHGHDFLFKETPEEIIKLIEQAEEI